MMLLWSAKKSYLFVYTVPGRNGFWVRGWPASGPLLRMILYEDQAWLMRVQPCLPAGAVGFCAVFEGSARRHIERALGRAGRKTAFYNTVERCEQAEQHAARRAPRGAHVFGLAAPAGRIPWLAGTDPWPGSDDEHDQRSRSSS